MRSSIGLLLAVTLLNAGVAGAQSTDAVLATFSIEGKMVNALVQFTRTMCLPSKGNPPGSRSFILISEKPVFLVEASKKAWIIVAVASIGSSLNDRPGIKADELALSDVNQAGNRLSFVMPAAIVKALQRRVS